MRIGMLTGGGDCPGLNAVIRAAVRKGVHELGHEFVGFRDGWKGPMEGLTTPLDVPTVRDILGRGGTILGSSRTNPLKTEGGVDRIRATFAELGVDALIAIGGEDTLGVATALGEQDFPVVGVPKTIDNDLDNTDFTFGFDTAVNTVVEAVERLRTTAESHHRAMVVEVMGRHAGWIALHSGIAAGADVTLIPEVPFDIDAVSASVRRVLDDDRAPIVVVAEGATPAEGTMSVRGETELDAFGHVRLGGIGELIASELEQRLDVETRATVLGHLQRGGSPSAFDRWLGTRFGLHAVDAVHEGAYGVMVALHGTAIERVPLRSATGQLKVVTPELYAEVQALSG